MRQYHAHINQQKINATSSNSNPSYTENLDLDTELNQLNLQLDFQLGKIKLYLEFQTNKVNHVWVS